MIWAHNNLLTLLPLSIGNLRNLEIVDFSNNKLLTVPDEITKLKHLHSLNLSGNNLQSLPLCFGEMRTLQKLDLSKNHLWQLPHSFKRLYQLRYLKLGENAFHKFPKQLLGFHQLTVLGIQHNKLTNVPQQLQKLFKLKKLNFADNKFEYMPHAVTKLTSLTSLDMSQNRLHSLQLEVQKLCKLQVLNLQQNMLQNIPEITSLVYLNISDNRLENLHLSQNKSLRYLDASFNALQIMPMGIYNQKFLEVLRLKSNYIDYISQDIVLLQNLKYLDISHNLLQTLPQMIYHLDNLTRFDIEGNPLEPQIPWHFGRVRLYKPFSTDHNEIQSKAKLPLGKSIDNRMSQREQKKISTKSFVSRNQERLSSEKGRQMNGLCLPMKLKSMSRFKFKPQSKQVPDESKQTDQKSSLSYESGVNLNSKNSGERYLTDSKCTRHGSVPDRAEKHFIYHQDLSDVRENNTLKDVAGEVELMLKEQLLNPDII